MRFVTALYISAISVSFAGNTKIISPDEYVASWSATAVSHMKSYKIPASITLAQGIVESGNGNSPLAVQANNHFGIKCHEWTGEKIYLDDDEKGECFRKYENGDESYRDHSLFLVNRSRYAKLFTFDPTDYKAWAKGLKEAGYATSPVYPQKLIEVIERLGLRKFDNELEQPGTEALAKELEKGKKQDKDVRVKPVKADNYQAHQVKTNDNRMRYVLARQGDTYAKIAREMDMAQRQLYRYNDFGPKKDILEEGDIVWLQPKRRHAAEKDAAFTAKENTTLREISQATGVKLESLTEFNQSLGADETVRKGQKIRLR